MSVSSDIAKIRDRLARLERRIEFRRVGTYDIWGDPKVNGAIRIGKTETGNELGFWVRENDDWALKNSWG